MPPISAEPGETETDQDEVRRVADTFLGYERDPRKQRAWDIANPANVLMRREVIDALLEETAGEMEGGAPLLDVGCGHGLYLEELVRRGVPAERLHGVDVVDELLESAAERIPGAHLARADARNLPHGDDTFGVVVLFTVLSAIGDEIARDIVADAKRVLKPGGALAVYDMRWPSPRNPNVHHMTRRRLEEVLGAGTRFRSLTVLPPVSRRLGAQTERLYPVLSRIRPLRTHWLALWPG